MDNGWDEYDAAHQTWEAPTHGKSTKSGKKPASDFKLSRKIGALYPTGGVMACPDCHLELFLEKGREASGAFCMGCAGDPGEAFHYVTEKTLRARAARRQAAAEAMAAAAAIYNAPRPPARPAPISEEKPVALIDVPDWVNDMFVHDFEITPEASPDNLDEGDLPL